MNLLKNYMRNPDWRKRLIACIEDDARSDRQLSLDADLSENYVQQMKKTGKNTGVQAVLKLCRELNKTPTYIFSGIELTTSEEEFISLFSSLQEVDQNHFLEYLRLKRSDT